MVGPELKMPDSFLIRNGLLDKPDATPQTDSILGSISRALTLLDERIEAAGKKLEELKQQREVFLADLRKIGAGE